MQAGNGRLTKLRKNSPISFLNLIFLFCAGDRNYHCPSSWLRKVVVSVPTFIVIYIQFCVCIYIQLCMHACIHVPVATYSYMVQKEMIHLVVCMQSVTLKIWTVRGWVGFLIKVIDQCLNHKTLLIVIKEKKKRKKTKRSNNFFFFYLA